MNIEIRIKDESISWEELTDLVHESFQERLDQGLHFSSSDITPEDFKRYGSSRIVLVAIDRDSNALAGTVSLQLNKKDDILWGYHGGLAVKPRYKRHGIATRLFGRLVEIAKENRCEYIQSDTSVGAKSSVKWHKKNGFKIVDLCSFKSTNYYSYIFKKDLTPHPDTKKINPIKEKLSFLKKALQCRMYHLSNGDERKSKLLDFYLKLRGAK